MLLQRFRRDSKGSIAPIFALAIVPIVGFVGAAVDYSHASSTRADLQAALDAAALIIFRDALTSTPDQLNQKALDTVKAQFTRADAQVPTVTANYSISPNTSITVSGTTSVQSDFMRLIGYPKLDIKASSTVQWGPKIRVALALDNTGSMADDGKMDALKSAAHGMLSTLQKAASKPGDILVSIVPFAKHVNVGASNYGASWIDWSYFWNQRNFYNSSSGRNVYCDPTWGGYCYDGFQAVQKNAAWPVAGRSTWKGCVTDRDQDNDAKNTTPVSGTIGTLFPAENPLTYTGQTVVNYCPVAQIMPLASDWTALNGRIDQMEPNGATNQTIGLALAWQTLTQGAPFSPPTPDATVKTENYIVLMSDGLNTQDRWYGDGSNVSTQVDARMNLVCTNAKAAGVKVYTIHVNTGGDPISTVLQNCASAPENFYSITTAGGMVGAFDKIAKQITALRIAK